MEWDKVTVDQADQLAAGERTRSQGRRAPSAAVSSQTRAIVGEEKDGPAVFLRKRLGLSQTAGPADFFERPLLLSRLPLCNALLHPASILRLVRRRLGRVAARLHDRSTCNKPETRPETQAAQEVD